MKLDSIIITPAAPDIVAEATQGRRYGKHQLLGSWRCGSGIRAFKTTMNGAPVDQSIVYNDGPSASASPFLAAMDCDWGEQDDGSGLRRGAMPVSIRLAIDPKLAQEGDE